MRGRALIATIAFLMVAAPAQARVREAGTVLPPGQSGFVTTAGLADGTGSPHLTDQLPLFLSFHFKNAMLGQPGNGIVESPRTGVTISRDAYGVPTIDGDSDYNLWFGAAYAVAEDRLFQLDLFRRATQGRLAEILGKDYLDDDLIARRDYYTPAEIDQQIAALPAGLRARFDAYRDGINAYIAQTRIDPTKVPAEFTATGDLPIRDWTDEDSAGIGVLLARTVPSDDGAEIDNARALQGIGPKAFDQLLPIRLPDQVVTIPKSEGEFPSQPGRTPKQEKAAFVRSTTFVDGLKLPPEPGADPTAKARATMAGIGRVGGSNMWAIRMPNGGATLFNGPQLGFQIPELFVEMELHGPGLNVRGATAPGVPVLGLGHNEELAKSVGMDVEQLEALRASERVPVSLETPIGSDGDTELGSLIPFEGPTPHEEVEVELEEASIRRALERLDPKARKVIELRFGIGGRDPLTLREVAEHVDLSPEGVRKLERRALMRLAEERELQGLAA